MVDWFSNTEHATELKDTKGCGDTDDQVNLGIQTFETHTTLNGYTH
jgi:hypothetical protein